MFFKKFKSPVAKLTFLHQLKHINFQNKLEHNIEPDNIYHDDDEKIDNTISLIDH